MRNCRQLKKNCCVFDQSEIFSTAAPTQKFQQHLESTTNHSFFSLSECIFFAANDTIQRAPRGKFFFLALSPQ